MFDKIDYVFLISKLSNAGIYSSLLRWLQFYISNRYQLVACNSFRSRTIHVYTCICDIRCTAGIASWTSFFYNVFINDIYICFRSSNFVLYAYDLKFYKRILCTNDNLDMQADLYKLKNFCDISRLVVNVDKCKVILFTRSFNTIIFNFNIINHKLIISERFGNCQ